MGCVRARCERCRTTIQMCGTHPTLNGELEARGWLLFGQPHGRHHICPTCAEFVVAGAVLGAALGLAVQTGKRP